LSVLV